MQELRPVQPRVASSPDVLKPIRKQSVADAAYQQLRDAIVSGQFAAGSQLPGERRLSELLAVNRGAVREALKRLEQDHLVRIHHGGATRVLDFLENARLDLVSQLLVAPSGELDAKVARSVIELRNVITPDIARLAALRGGARVADELDTVLTLMRDAGEDLAALQELGQTFMKALVRASDNIAYRLVYNTVQEVHLRYERPLRSLLADCYRDISPLEAIAKAVRDADGDRAAECARSYADAFASLLFKGINRLAQLEAGV